MPSEKSSTGLEANVAGLLCYLLGWITGIIFLIIEKESKFVRFHAVQSILTFGGLTVLPLFLVWIPFLGWILMIVIPILGFILWAVLMVKAYQGETYKLPVAGDIAKSQLAS